MFSARPLPRTPLRSPLAVRRCRGFLNECRSRGSGPVATPCPSGSDPGIVSGCIASAAPSLGGSRRAYFSPRLGDDFAPLFQGLAGHQLFRIIYGRFFKGSSRNLSKMTIEVHPSCLYLSSLYLCFTEKNVSCVSSGTRDLVSLTTE